jgi:hypothetical protein
MKAYYRLTGTILLIAATLLVIAGCEYDVTQSQWWDKNKKDTPTPVISQIVPDTAKAGVNTITIVGENFSVSPDTNDVYFNILSAEVIEATTTSIKVRRPNLVTDSCVIKVAPRTSLYEAKYGHPYKITAVQEKYGPFIENLFLPAIAVDASENIYVLSADSSKIFKYTPAGVRSVVAKATQLPTDAIVGPDNRLYMVGGQSGTGGNRNIYVCDLSTGIIETYVQLPSGKNVKFGDFDANGYLYAIGPRSDLYIIAPNQTFVAAGLYATNDVIAIRVFNNYLYLVVRTGTSTNPPTSIVRHPIGDNGTLGAAETVLDWSATPFGTLLIRDITFSADGMMYIATESTDPILVYDPLTAELDYFYKGILPSYIRNMVWGPGNYLYLVRGNTSLSEEWTVYRVDMGTEGAPVY